MSRLLQDIRFSLRQILRQPGFTIVAVVTLALGIGANTAVFSVLYGVLLRPLPYPEPARLAGFTQTVQGSSYEMGVTFLEARYLQEHGSAFEAMAAATPLGFNLATADQAEHVGGLRVSRDYFRVLGVVPMLGRVFAPEEDQPTGASAVILSYGLWQRQFGGNRAVIGSTVRLDGTPTVVVGVMPKGFQSVPEAELWSTLAQVSTTVGSGQNLEMLGRLKPGLTIERAAVLMGPAFQGFETEFSQWLPKGSRTGLAPLRKLVTSDVETPVRLLFGAIGFVLLIACANVANLLLGRAVTRQREFAVRVAMGAGRPRLIRQVLTESLVLAVAGGALGVLFGEWMLALLMSAVPDSLPRVGDIRLDHWALVFTVALALGTGLVFGALPALQAGRSNLHDSLREGAGRTTSSAGVGRWRNGLVVVEVALSLVLLAGAGLLIRTFANLMHEDPGFDPHGLVSAEIWLSGSKYQTPEATSAYYANLIRGLEAEPGVTGAAVVEAGLPLQRGGNMPVSIDGAPVRSSVDYRTVTPEYFQTLGLPVTAGRAFDRTDATGSAPVAVVNQAFAAQFFPEHGPLGRSIKVGGQGGVTPTIVGVVDNVRSYIGFPPPPTVFLLSAQTPAAFTQVFNGWFPIHVLVRAPTTAAGLLRTLPGVLHDVDPGVPVGRVRTLESVLANSLASQRFIMILLTVFAALAALLAAVGLYGVIAYLVTQRSHEIGVRLALGAERGDVLRMVLGNGLRLAGIGAVLGLLGAVALTRLLASQLFGVQPVDPVTLASVTAGIALVALAASYVPAWRATRIEAIRALRAE